MLPLDFDNLVYEELFREYYTVIVPRSNPLAKRKIVSVADLADQVLLVPKRDDPISKKIVDICHVSGVNLKVTYTWPADNEVVTVLSEFGNGIYIIPERVVDFFQIGSGMAIIPLDRTDRSCSLAVRLVWRRSETAVAVLDFVALARQLYSRA